MDPLKNPYSPGAGTRPPELAGRDGVIADVTVSLARLRLGRSMQCPILVGLRGVGKTVLLNHLYRLGKESSLSVALMEAPEKKSLPALLIPRLRDVLTSLSLKANASKKVGVALSALRNFIASVKIKFSDVEVTVLNAAKADGLADSGDFDSDLSSLLQSIGEAAKDSDSAVVLFIDELQFVPEKELGSLIAALHQCAQMDLPVTLVGAGLPQLVGNVGRAKSYSERLFKFHTIDKLDDTAARLAIERPAAAEGVSFEPDALSEILLQTHNYPYFLQEWGDKCWAEAVASPVTLDDVSRATEVAIKHLDESFFAVRFDRCTPLERTYMRAMAELGDDSVRSGEVATLMNRSVQQLAPSRSSLIKKGMIYSPAHGDAAFTVPLFAQYMRRRIPGFE